MIRVHFQIERWKNKEPRYTLKFTGHSNYAPKGEPDIVCAGVSALFYGLGSALMSSAELLQDEKVDIRYEKGKGLITCVTKNRDAESVIRRTFWDYLCGIDNLTHHFPKNVSLECKPEYLHSRT